VVVGEEEEFGLSDLFWTLKASARLQVDALLSEPIHFHQGSYHRRSSWIRKRCECSLRMPNNCLPRIFIHGGGGDQAKVSSDSWRRLLG
jgi:hypothetical protein